MRKMMTALALAGGLAVSMAGLASAASLPMVTPTAAPTPLVHVQYYGGGYRGGPRHRYWRHDRWRRHHYWHHRHGY